MGSRREGTTMVTALDMKLPERLSTLHRDCSLTRAIAPSVSADNLVFDIDMGGPDSDLVVHIRAIQHFSDNEKHIVKTFIDSVLLPHEAHRYAPTT